MIKHFLRIGSRILGGEYAGVGLPDLVIRVEGSSPEIEEWALSIIAHALEEEVKWLGTEY